MHLLRPVARFVAFTAYSKDSSEHFRQSTEGAVVSAWGLDTPRLPDEAIKAGHPYFRCSYAIVCAGDCVCDLCQPLLKQITGSWQKTACSPSHNNVRRNDISRVQMPTLDVGSVATLGIDPCPPVPENATVQMSLAAIIAPSRIAKSPAGIPGMLCIP